MQRLSPALNSGTALLLVLLVASFMLRPSYGGGKTESSQPLHRGVTISILASRESGTGSFTVPAGKRYVIEYASGLVRIPAGQQLRMTMMTQLNGQNMFHYVPMVLQQRAGASGIWAAGQPVRLYADPGSTVQIWFHRTAVSGSGVGNGAVCGRLEDL